MRLFCLVESCSQDAAAKCGRALCFTSCIFCITIFISKEIIYLYVLLIEIPGTINLYKDDIVKWRIHKLLLPHNLYSGNKHIPLSSQKAFVLLVPISFGPDNTNNDRYSDPHCSLILCRQSKKLLFIFK